MSTGKAWEAQLRAACERHHRAGRLTWQQNHEEIRQVGKEVDGVFPAQRRALGPCDFSGELAPHGRGWTCDAKDCEGQRWGFDDLADHQAARLDGCHHVGGLAFVALRLEGVGWVLPWARLRGPWVAWDNLRRQRKRAGRGAASWAPADGFGLRMVGADWFGALFPAEVR